MNILVVKFLGTFHILLGFLYLLIPIILIELGRPKDLIKGGIFLLIGFILLFQQSIIQSIYSILLILYSILLAALFFEVISHRWNQLSEKEKLEFKTISILKKKFSLFVSAINLGFKKNFIRQISTKMEIKNSVEKKWVRPDDENILKKNKKNISKTPDKLQSEKSTGQDIIIDEKTN